ncbi:MAG: Na+/H+ antiporter NhaC family protein [Fidelibacterota bacterium]
MGDVGWLSVLPPLIAIFLAIWTKQVYLSLFAGIWLGWIILSSWNPLVGLEKALEALIKVFESGSNTKVILFSALVGALIIFTQRSGGVDGFVNWITSRNLVRGRRSAGLLAWFIGMVIFVESSITCLVTGAIARPIFDRYRISREKLAYIIDSTSAPVCIIIPLNAWGAYIIGLLSAQGFENPVKLFVRSIPFNFYAIFAILIVLTVIISQRDVGEMKKAEKRALEEGKLIRDGAEPMVSTDIIAMPRKEGVSANPINMILPVLVMVIMMPISLIITGRSDLAARGSDISSGGVIDFLMNGSGSTSVFWSVLAAIIFAALLYRWQGLMRINEMVDLFLKGVGGMIPVASLMILAFAIGNTCSELGTGIYVSNFVKSWLNPGLLPAVLFLTSCFIAFSTGTSWGTFAIMIPIGIPLISALHGPLYLSLAAILGGGIFGDHSSPISDTTIISSLSSVSDHIDHVRTQLPYALMAAGTSVVFYLIVGLLLWSSH